MEENNVEICDVFDNSTTFYDSAIGDHNTYVSSNRNTQNDIHNFDPFADLPNNIVMTRNSHHINNLAESNGEIVADTIPTLLSPSEGSHIVNGHSFEEVQPSQELENVDTISSSSQSSSRMLDFHINDATTQYLPIEQTVGLLETPDREQLADIFSYLDDDPRHLRFVMDQYERLHLEYVATIRAGQLSESGDSDSNSNNDDVGLNVHPDINMNGNVTTSISQIQANLKDNSSPTDGFYDFQQIELFHNFPDTNEHKLTMDNLIDNSYTQFESESLDFPDLTWEALEFDKKNSKQEMIDKSIDSAYSQELGSENETGIPRDLPIQSTPLSPWDEIDITEIPTINSDLPFDSAFRLKTFWGDFEICETTEWDVQFAYHFDNNLSTNPVTNSNDPPINPNSGLNKPDTQLEKPSENLSFNTEDGDYNNINQPLSEEAKRIIQATMSSIQFNVPPHFKRFNRPR